MPRTVKVADNRCYIINVLIGREAVKQTLGHLIENRKSEEPGTTK
jgi:hypothetical protein